VKSSGDSVNNVGEFGIEIGQATRVVSDKPDLDFVVNAVDFRVMAELLRFKGDGGEEAEGFDEILEFEASMQLSVFGKLPFGKIFWGHLAYHKRYVCCSCSATA
jgi:hypothetical protein